MKGSSRMAYFLLESFILFTFLLGCILYFVGYTSSRKYSRTMAEMKKCTEQTTATVVHVNQFQDYNADSGTYTYTYEGKFTYTVDGTEYTGRYKSSAVIENGDSWEIVYDPADPARYFKKTDVERMPSRQKTAKLFFIPGKVLAGFALLLSVILVTVKIVNKVRARIVLRRENTEGLY